MEPGLRARTGVSLRILRARDRPFAGSQETLPDSSNPAYSSNPTKSDWFFHSETGVSAREFDGNQVPGSNSTSPRTGTLGDPRS
jgi:hypothetical protein